MPQKNISGKDLSGTVTSDDLLGKDVIDADGKIIGVSEKILIDPINLNFVGIGIDKGVLSKGLTIGKGYIRNITKHAIFLKIRILHELMSMLVFDNHGRKIGKVKKVVLHGSRNKLNYIEVKSGFFRKLITVEEKYIQKIGDHIILNLDKEKLNKK